MTTFHFNERACAVMELASRMLRVEGDWRDRFSAIRHNYRLYETAVGSGLVSWGYPRDPCVIANWQLVMSPIERITWDEIKSEGLPFWPQFPVGRFMVDFGDPVKKVAIECDGAQFHDPDRDWQRDREIEALGWRVFRIEGRECFKDHLLLRDGLGNHIPLGAFRNEVDPFVSWQAEEEF